VSTHGDASTPLTLTVLLEPWRPHPLAWIHRGEGREVAGELRRAGHAVRVARFRAGSAAALPAGPLLLRLSDPVMLAAVGALTRAGIPFIGPSAAVMARCYDKYEAHRIAIGNGVDCPPTALGSTADGMPFPLIVKPRRGSDSIGLRLASGRLPARAKNDRYLVQERVLGSELTVAVVDGRVGAPLRLDLPEGVLYTFARKYLLRPRRSPVADAALSERARSTARTIAAMFGVNWAARVDLIHETATGRLRFLECDVAPLVGPRSAFAASLAAAGVERAEQLRLLLGSDGAPRSSSA